MRLEPLTLAHYPVLLAGLEPDLFLYMYPHPLRDAGALKDGSAKPRVNQQVYVSFDQKSGSFAGSTSLYTLNSEAPTFEIGSTWVKKAFQGTKLNLESKYLLLRHCFADLSAIRVQIRTHNANLRSKRAIEKLGLTLEGIVRHEGVMPDGSIRDTALYSAINSEWPALQRGLEQQLYGAALSSG